MDRITGLKTDEMKSKLYDEIKKVDKKATEYRFTTKIEGFVNENKWKETKREDKSLISTICTIFGKNIPCVIADVEKGPRKPELPFYLIGTRDNVCI